MLVRVAQTVNISIRLAMVKNRKAVRTVVWVSFYREPRYIPPDMNEAKLFMNPGLDSLDTVLDADGEYSAVQVYISTPLKI